MREAVQVGQQGYMRNLYPPLNFAILAKISLKNKVFKHEGQALAGVAQWIEHQPANQGVAGSIPSQGTCLAYGLGP